MKQINVKKLVLLNLPYVFLGLYASKLGQAWRLAAGADASEKLLHIMDGFSAAFQSALPSFHPADLVVGLLCGAALRLAVYMKGKNAKKYRHGMEYGTARWGSSQDIAPYIAPKFEDNIILTQTERLTMNSRPKDPKTARNKNVLVIGGSGSGKTRFFLKPNLMQCTSDSYPTSFVVTDPKGDIVIDTGKLLQRKGYRIKILNSINFKKSMHYNPFAYLHSEKDILKLVTTLIANTKGEGKGGDDFWVKAETLLYTALIGYIYYEAPKEEQNFSTLVEFINAMEVREDDEEFKNPVDLMFDELAERDPNHFAVRQYAKYRLAAGDICSTALHDFGHIGTQARFRVHAPADKTMAGVGAVGAPLEGAGKDGGRFPGDGGQAPGLIELHHAALFVLDFHGDNPISGLSSVCPAASSSRWLDRLTRSSRSSTLPSTCSAACSNTSRRSFVSGYPLSSVSQTQRYSSTSCWSVNWRCPSTSPARQAKSSLAAP